MRQLSIKHFGEHFLRGVGRLFDVKGELDDYYVRRIYSMSPQDHLSQSQAVVDRIFVESCGIVLANFKKGVYDDSERKGLKEEEQQGETVTAE